MSIMPGGKAKPSGNVTLDAPTREVFYKDTDGTMKGTGMIVLPDNTLLAPEGFGAESGSINFGDLITLSEASGFLAIQNNLNGNRYRLIDHYVPRDAPSSKPGYIQMIEAEAEFDSQPDQSQTLTSNPLIFSYTTQLTSRVNSIKWRVASPMTNVRFKITKTDVNVAVKYYPSKAAWTEGTGGVNFASGDHVTDFLDTPLLFTPGTTLQFEVRADSVSLKGSSAGIASFSAMIQRGEFKYVAIADDISGASIKASLESLQAPNKLAKSAIQDVVNTVNGQFGDVSVTATSINAQPVNSNLTNISGLALSADKVIGTDSAGAITQLTLSPLSKSVLASNSGSFIQSLLGVPTAVSGFTNDAGYITSAQAVSAQVNADWNSVSGKSQILNKPSLFSGAYADLTGKPVLFSGNYADLSGKPTIPAAQIQSDWNQTNTASLDFIKNKPAIPSVNYPVTSVNTKTGAVVLTNTDVGAAATSHTHVIADVTGLQTSLDSKATTTSLSAYVTNSSLTTTLTGYATNSALTSGLSGKYNTPTGTTLQYIRGDGSVATFPTIPTVPTNVSAFTNDSGYITNATLTGYRKVETFLGTTDATGNLTITFANTYSTPPDVQPQIIGGTFNQSVRVVSVSNTGCVVQAAQRNLVTLLSVEVLLGATANLVGASVTVQITPRS